jgi:ABC-2 type transport system permease protein
LRLRDAFLVSNPAYFLMLLFCGVNVPLSALPGWMSAIGRALPLTHGIAAARRVAAGAPLGDVSTLLWTEAAIGAAWAVAAYAMLRVFEAESRRTAALDRI